jgi:YNFM family putative membrane transporter
LSLFFHRGVGRIHQQLIPQPARSIPQHEFSGDMVVVPFTLSVIILGVAYSNLPFGCLVERLPIHRIIPVGGG